MKRRTLLGAVALAGARVRAQEPAASAAAQASDATAMPAPTRKYVGLSLVGDHYSYVAPADETGSRIARGHTVDVPVPDAAFDRVVLQAFAAALAQSTLSAGAPRSFLMISDPAVYESQEDWFGSGKVDLPAKVASAVRAEQATHLVLATKRSVDASKIQSFRMSVGHGRITGLGIYVDHETPVHEVKTREYHHGFVAPFVSVSVSLVELPSLKVLHREAIMSAKAYTDMLSADERPMLARMLASEVSGVMPMVLAAG